MAWTFYVLDYIIIITTRVWYDKGVESVTSYIGHVLCQIVEHNLKYYKLMFLLFKYHLITFHIYKTFNPNKISDIYFGVR